MIGQIFSTFGQTALSLMATGALHVATALTSPAATAPIEPDRMDLVSGPDDRVASISPHQVQTGLTMRARAFARDPSAVFSSGLPQRAIPKQGNLGSILAFGLLVLLGAGAALTLLRAGRREDQDSEPIVVTRRQDVVATGQVLSVVDTLDDLPDLRSQLRRARLSLQELERVLGFLIHGEDTRRQKEALDFLFEVLSGTVVDQSSQSRVLRGLSEFLTRFPNTPLSSEVYTRLQYLVISHPDRFGGRVVRLLEGLLDARYPRRTVQARSSLAILATAARPDIARSARGVLSRFAEAEEADDSAGVARMARDLEAIGSEEEPF